MGICLDTGENLFTIFIDAENSGNHSESASVGL